MSDVNFGDLLGQAADFEPLTPGNYNMFVEKAEHRVASTGKDMIVIKFRVEDGPKKGKPITNNFVISPESPEALGFFFRHMAAMGLNKEFFAQNPSMELVAQNLLGKRCRVQVGIRQWNGDDRNEVKAVAPPEGAQNVQGVPGLPGDTLPPAQTSATPPQTPATPVGSSDAPPAPELPF